MRSERGDTMVEVLMATVLLSIVLAAAYTLSNRATRLNQQAFERTQITKLMQQQAELVRAARDGGTPTWDTVKTYEKATVTDLGNNCRDLTTLPSSARFTSGTGAFYVEEDGTVTGDLKQEGFFYVWSELERGAGGNNWTLKTFGCWESVADSPNNETAIFLRLGDTF